MSFSLEIAVFNNSTYSTIYASNKPANLIDDSSLSFSEREAVCSGVQHPGGGSQEPRDAGLRRPLLRHTQHCLQLVQTTVAETDDCAER